MNEIQADPIIILMADDDPDDRLLIEDALEENRLANDLHFVEDGEQLMAYLHRHDGYSHLATAPLPGLILLDLNMPKKDGREALAEIKADPKLRCIPIVILTTSKTEEDICRAYKLNCNCYITKPVDLKQFVEVIRSIENFWFTIVTLPPEPRR